MDPRLFLPRALWLWRLRTSRGRISQQTQILEASSQPENSPIFANNIPVKEMPADWNRYGNSAGPMRNRQMAEYADAAVIIWDGYSRGTRNMVENMIRRKKPYYIGMTSATLEDFV